MVLGLDAVFTGIDFFSSAANVEEGSVIASPARLADFRNERRFMDGICKTKFGRMQGRKAKAWNRIGRFEDALSAALRDGSANETLAALAGRTNASVPTQTIPSLHEPIRRLPSGRRCGW